VNNAQFPILEEKLTYLSVMSAVDQ